MPNRDIIAVGASAGGLAPLSALVERLPADLPAAVFVVQHTASNAESVLAQILGRAGPLPAAQAEDGAPIECGHIYVAPPDLHLKLDPGRVRVVHGPRHNRARPAVDPLFRSAAAAYGSRVVGVVLSGYLDDGTAGLRAVERAGGVAVVQDPGDALYPGMPQSALDHVAVDHRLPADEIGPALSQLAQESVPAAALHEHAAPEDATSTHAMSNGKEYTGDNLNENGRPAALTCPGCGGPLWVLEEGELQRYECLIGHSYTPSTLLADKDEGVEQALEVALRTLEERARMLLRMAQDAEDKNRGWSAERFEERAQESEAHADSLRELLEGGV